ncbi:hypothetical protein Bbelb_249140 [Branchiostoma belcheri]|nr:hypothetical protein Bbelb_249140 [Branchiostoma belcheri]
MASGHDQTGQGQSQANTESNTNTTATVMASGDNRQYEDVDCPRVKTGQGNIQCLNIGNLSHNQVLAALKPNHMYAGNTAVSVMASGDYHQYENVDCPRVKTGQGQYQAITEPNTNITATVMASGDDQTGQGQSQTNTESNTNNTATVMTSGDDQTGQGQSQTNTESNTNNTATVMTSGDDQTGQGQSQTNTESNTNNTATVMTSGDDQTGQGQSQTNTESTTHTTATVMAIDHYYQNDDFENNYFETEQGRSQTNTESNTNTTATVMTSGQDDIGQANAQSPTVANLSRNEVLAALQPNPMYVDAKTPPKNPTSMEMASGPDQTGRSVSCHH